MKNIPWVNVLRGIAILLMIPANFGGLWATPHPMWFRIMGSYAAPTFIMLSAGMVILHAQNHNLKYYLQRGSIIIGIAAFIDLACWKQFPFLWIDVLYLIGLLLPVCYLVSKCSMRVLIFFALFFVLLSPMMQNILKYHEMPLTIRLSDMHWPGSFRILTSWLVDGWFPLFPWLSYGFFGCILFKTLSKYTEYHLPDRLAWMGLLIAIMGFILLFIPTSLFSNFSNGGIYSDRYGVSDIFYPPTLAYILSSIGVVLLLVKFSQVIETKKISRMISVFGQHSMLAYLLHSFFIALGYFIMRSMHLEPVISNNLLFFAIVTSSILIIYFISLYVQNCEYCKKSHSLILQIILGVGGKRRDQSIPSIRD